jgi:hypothetical protein
MLMNADPIMTARELATHTSDIKHLQDDMDKLVNDVAEMKSSLADIKQKLDQVEGGWKALMWKISNNLIWCVTILDLTCSLPDSGAIDRHWRRVTFTESFSYTIWSRIRIIQVEFFFALDVVTAFFLQSSFEKMQLLYLSSLFLHEVS